jgi:putative chitinase
MNLDDLSVPDKVKQELWPVMSKFGINTIDRLAHFLAQCHHESGGFTKVRENLSYSVSGLKKVFPKYFKDRDPKAYSKAPQALANYVYANRLGNGSEASGDGWKYRGRGYIQLTGKDNYRAFDAFVDDDILVGGPDLVATKYPLLSAAWFWSVNKINNLADAGIDVDVITRVTKKVNGGHKGLHERIMFTHRYYAELSVKGT